MACEDKTSITCARVMRGINSIAKADTPASAITFSAASLP
ncbi:hypothetical protein ACVMDN_006617 [Bradyrhizobium sp. USDA 4510]